MAFDQTGLPFVPPSPNLRTLESLFHYPGTCLFEGTNLSVGRGSDAPFEQIGAPWLDTAAVLSALREADTWVWAEFSPRAAPRPWPPGDEVRGFKRWYVHWRGTIHGPDRYGHLGVGSYQATFDTLLTMRRPGGTDCA